MSTQFISLLLIDPNPWQTRTHDDPAHIASIADSIRENRDAGIGESGLLQIPMGRQVGDRTQLAFGMSRFAAWQNANPDLPFPVNVVELTDRQMSDLAAEENAKRKNLNAIETAQAIQRRMKDFNLTQVEAAKPFGYTAQGTISNLLRLLKLPDAVQTLVADGKLAERNARALLVATKLAPAKDVVKIAAQSISTDNPEEAIDDALKELLEDKGCDLDDAPWDLAWTPAPMELASAAVDFEMPACKSCAFYFARDRQKVCGQKSCFDAKFKMTLPGFIATRAQQLGIAAGAPGEKSAVLWDGYGQSAYELGLEKLLKSKRAELRLVAYTPNPNKTNWNSGYERKRYLGSELLALATTDKAATLAWLKADGAKRQEIKKEERAETLKTESEAQRKKRLEREKTEELERRAERSAFLKSKYDVLWLAENAAKLFAEQMVIAGGILTLVAEDSERNYNIYNQWTEWQAIEERLENDAEELGLRQLIAFRIIAHAITAEQYGASGTEKVYNFSEAHQSIVHIAEEELDIQLPKHWDEPPIHHTAFNCWHCGVFAPGEKLTKRDVDEFGWIDNFVNAETSPQGGVFCGNAHFQASTLVRSKANRARKKAASKSKSKAKRR